MPVIKLLTTKIINPIERGIKRTSSQVSKLIKQDNYFANFEKQDEKVESGFFKDIFGEYKYWAFKRIAEKYKWVKDSKIKKHINEKLYYQKSEKIDYSEDLMDAYNVLKGHYSILSDVDKYYKQYKKSFGEENAAYMAKLSKWNKEMFNMSLEYSKKDKPSLVKSFKEDINFVDDQQTEALKKYVATYSQAEPEMTNYMYTKYYLPRLSKNVRLNCEKISKEFGTKVFVYDEKEQPNLDFIYDELMDWKVKSEGKTKFPSIIDLSKIKEAYIGKIENHYHIHSTGLFNPNDKSISLDYLDSIRHEMIHYNTKNGLLQEFYFQSIQKNRTFEKELINAGIPSNQIEIAYGDKGEFIAYASEGDCLNHSDEFKKTLIKLGLPEWVFDLKPLKQIAEE